MEKFQKHISSFEIAVAVIIYLLLVVITITQLFFGGGVLLFWLVVAACAGVFSYLVFVPETYEFQKNAIVIEKAGRGKSTCIPYENVIKFDTVGSFLLAKKDADMIEVILTYRPAGKSGSTTVSCHPKKVHEFVKVLQRKCPDVLFDPI